MREAISNTSPQDTYWPEPQAPYDERRQLHLEYCAAQSPGGRTGFISQIARLELGLDVDESPIQEGIAFVDSRQDCCDFAVGGLLRILYRYPDSPRFDNPYSQCASGAAQVAIRRGGETLVLDLGEFDGEG